MIPRRTTLWTCTRQVLLRCKMISVLPLQRIDFTTCHVDSSTISRSGCSVSASTIWLTAFLDLTIKISSKPWRLIWDQFSATLDCGPFVNSPIMLRRSKTTNLKRKQRYAQSWLRNYLKAIMKLLEKRKSTTSWISLDQRNAQTSRSRERIWSICIHGLIMLLFNGSSTRRDYKYLYKI